MRANGSTLIASASLGGRPCCMALGGVAGALTQACASQDAGWAPRSAAQRDATGVVIGSGMSCTADLAAAGVAIAAGHVRK